MGDQAEALRFQLKHEKKTDEAKTIAIASGKGGVGKSNFAINFSIELTKKGMNVLLIDLDVGMGNIEILLGLQAKQTIADLFEKRLPIESIIESGPHQLAFIAGGTGLNEIFTPNHPKLEYFFQEYKKLVHRFDYIIFDMGAGVSDMGLALILAADESIVITTPEPPAITDAYSMIKHIVNNSVKMPIYVVMNRAKTPKTGMKALERFKQIIAQFLHVDIRMLGVLPDDPSVSKAVIQQTPYVLLNEKSPISKAIGIVANNYVRHLPISKKKEPFSFVRRLAQLIRER